MPFPWFANQHATETYINSAWVGLMGYGEFFLYNFPLRHSHYPARLGLELGMGLVGLE